MHITTKYTCLLEKNEKNIISLDELKHYLRIDYEDEDNLLEIFIHSATEEAENIIGKTILPQTWKQDVELLLDNCDRDFLFEFPIMPNAKVQIPLVHKPIINITKVWAGKNELNKEDYNVKTSTGTPVLCINSRALIGMAQNKKILLGITYETGMYPNTLSVPNKIKLSILMLAANKFYHREVVYPTPFSERDDSGIKKLLAEYRDYSI